MHCDKEVWSIAVSVLSSQGEHAGSYAVQRAKDASEHDDISEQVGGFSDEGFGGMGAEPR
jgi:tRNA isopentenyl-2-thiomethyl-A-37 hydroxylase MiaE